MSKIKVALSPSDLDTGIGHWSHHDQARTNSRRRTSRLKVLLRSDEADHDAQPGSLLWVRLFGIEPVSPGCRHQQSRAATHLRVVLR